MFKGNDEQNDEHHDKYNGNFQRFMQKSTFFFSVAMGIYKIQKFEKEEFD